MKIVHPITHELGILKLRLEEAEQELSISKRENALLRQKIVQLKGKTSRQQKSSLSSSTSPDGYNSAHPHTPSGIVAEVSITSNTRPIPSYAAGTKASQARSRAKDCPIISPIINQSTDKDIVIDPGFNNVDGWDTAPLTPGWTSTYHTYQNGCLVTRTANFLQPTEASSAKRNLSKERAPKVCHSSTIVE